MCDHFQVFKLEWPDVLMLYISKEVSQFSDSFVHSYMCLSTISQPVRSMTNHICWETSKQGWMEKKQLLVAFGAYIMMVSWFKQCRGFSEHSFIYLMSLNGFTCPPKWKSEKGGYSNVTFLSIFHIT